MRGPKTPRKNGLPFILDRSKEIMHVEWKDPMDPMNQMDPTKVVNHAKNENPMIPTITVVQELMWMAFAVFQGGYIISNLIESMNSNVRLAIPSRGVKTMAQLRDHVNGFVQTRNKHTSGGFGSIGSSMSLPVRSSLGFFNLDKFMSPQIENIAILTSFGGD